MSRRHPVTGHKGHFEYRYLPEIVYGGIDGSVTTFAVVAGVIGASLSASIVLILGFANLFADGFSMAISNYLSKRSEQDSGIVLKKTPAKSALVTFSAFFLIGLAPLLPFILAFFLKIKIDHLFTYSAVLTALAFLFVGYFKGDVLSKHKIKSAIETLAIGGIAAVLAFTAGYLLRGLA